MGPLSMRRAPRRAAGHTLPGRCSCRAAQVGAEALRGNRGVAGAATGARRPACAHDPHTRPLCLPRCIPMLLHLAAGVPFPRPWPRG